MDRQQIIAQLKEEISRLEQAVRALEGGSLGRGGRRGGRRTLSAAARARIAAAQRARWAKVRKAKSS